MTTKKTNKSLYISIPFCQTICTYCSYCKLLYQDRFVKDYLVFLQKELTSKNIPLKSLKTIYIGGGTPNSLNDDDLESLIMSLIPLLADQYEFTIELNIELITYNQLQILKRLGINRLSIGIQTFNQQILDKINRRHDPKMVSTWIKEARQLGFNNISVDLMYGFEGQQDTELINDLSLITSFNLEHISIYPLTIDQNSLLGIKNYPEMDEKLFVSRYFLVQRFLKQHGYQQYELVNYAKDKKYQSCHNLAYWHNQEYYAIGLGAAFFENNTRGKNTSSLKQYLLGKYLEEIEEQSPKSNQENFIIFSLRTKMGVDIQVFKEQFKTEIFKIYKEVIEDLIKRKLIYQKGRFLRVYQKHLLIIDYIGRYFIQ